jgi:diguanylate cyclase (GGDEF)-like protein/PAS domain S-box-containing protein
MRSRSWLIFLVLGFAASFAAAVLGTDAQLAVTLLLGAIAGVIGIRVAVRNPGPVRRTWTLFGLAGAGFLAVGVVQFALGESSDAFPNPSHMVFALAYVALIAGTYHMGSVRTEGINAAAHVDGLIVAIGTATVVWGITLWPYMVDPSVPLEARLVNAAFSVLSILLLATTTRLAVGPGVRSTSYYLLAGAVACIFATDVAATLATVNGTRSDLSLILGPFVFTMYVAAALHPAMPRLFDPPSDRVLQLTTRRIVLLAAGLLVTPIMLLWIDLTGRDLDLMVMALGSGLMAVVVLARFRMLVRAQERAVEIQRIQREANADLAAASSRHAMHRATLRAVVRLAADLPGLRVSIAQVVGNSLRILDSIGQDAESAVGTSIEMDLVHEPLVNGLRSLELTSVENATPIDLSSQAAGGATTALLVAPLRSQNELSGALLVSSRRPMTANQAQSVATLASTVSLALESAVLTENLLRRRSERRFRALVENSSDIVWVVDRDRQITFASPAADRLLGLSESTLLGSHPARWVHPDDWPSLARVLERATTPGHDESDTVEVRFRHLDGGHRWFEVRARDLQQDPEIEGLVVTAREISDRKATEQQLAASEARFRALVQSSSDVVAVIASDGRFTYLSPAVDEMLGYRPDELVGTRAIALVAPEEVDGFQSTYPELSQMRLPLGDITTRRVETQLRHRSGELRTVDITVSDMRADPAVGGIVLNARDITVRKALEADLRFQALHDTLTGLANRTMFTQQTASALRMVTDGEVVGALFIDLDDFKTVNDSLGHAVGDHLLQEVSSRLVTSLSGRDLAARLGGDEFAVLVVDAPTQGGVVALADDVLALVAQPYRIQGRDIRVTASIGIAFAEEGTDAEVLLRSADVAMYLAKDRGKNRHAVFEAHMHTSVFERLELKADLVRAIDDGQLRCHYQPIVSLQTGRITGVEALVRWEHPTRGILFPDAFIPLAEDTGLIVPLGRWVMREACQQLRSWQLSLPATATLSMSINLSVRQLMHEQIIRDVREAIDDAGLDPSTVTLEITETTLMHDTEMTRDRLADLRRIGVSLAVDDFGTGYSSLQYVQRFPIDIIKIDRSFIAGLGTNAGDGAVVQSMIELSQRLGVHTVAEGIDRAEQVTLLQSLGADLGQGYLFSKPVEASEIDALLAASPNESPRFLMH